MPSRLFFVFAVVGLVAGPSCRRAPPETCTGETVRLAREDVVSVGTDFAFPPFAFDDPQTGKPTGFEVDLTDAVAQQVGLKVLLVNRTSAALIPGLLAHRHDLAASALVDSPDLRRVACVSAPYLEADLGLLARSGKPPSVDGTADLEGRSVAVVRGSRADRWAQANVPATSRIVRVEAAEDLLTVLRAKQVDGAIDDLAVLRFRQTGAPDITVVETMDTGESYVLAASSDNKGLIDLVNEALRRMRAKGQLKALRTKWFGG